MSKTHELHSICAMVPPDTGPPDWSLFVSSLEETATEARDTAAGEAKADDAETRGRELLRIHGEAMRAVGHDDPPSEAMKEAAHNALLKELSPPEEEEPPTKPEPETWDQEDPPPPREWIVPGVLPVGRLASLYGPPAIGKSTFVMQLSAAVLYGGCPVIPRDPKSKHPLTLAIPEERCGRVLLVTWEDETAEILRRWRAAHQAGALGPDAPALPDPARLTIIEMRRHGGIWGPDQGKHRAIVSRWTKPAGEAIIDMLAGHTVAIFDPIAAAYADNEIDRAAVRAFTSALDIAGEDVGCTTLLVGHPAKAATDTGGRYSGSTDWDAAPRARMEMDLLTAEGTPPSRQNRAPTACAISITKISYGPRYREPLWLRYAVNPGFALVEGGPPEADAFAEEPERRTPDEERARKVI